MLVLTRKENESIQIGDNILITVTRIQGNRIRFAIDAPKETRIVRGELQLKANHSPTRNSVDDAGPKSCDGGYETRLAL